MFTTILSFLGIIASIAISHYLYYHFSIDEVAEKRGLVFYIALIIGVFVIFITIMYLKFEFQNPQQFGVSIKKVSFII